jgi:hypothetical protein
VAPAARPAVAAAGHPARLAARFCTDASTFMRSIPAGPTTTNLTPAQAQADMNAVLVSTVLGFTRLETEAPARLRAPLQQIIRVYQSDENVLRTTGNMARVSESVVRNDASGAASERQVVTYISVSCR